MMQTPTANRRTKTVGVVAAMVLAAWPAARARAQNADRGAPADGARATPAATVAPVAPVAPLIPPPPEPAQMEMIPLPAELDVAAPRRRSKPLKTTAGIPPTAADLGSEADVVSSADEIGESPLIQSRNWSF